MKNNALLVLLLLSTAIMGSRNTNQETNRIANKPDTDTLLYQSIWNMDTIPAPMGGWASISFTPDKKAYFTTFYYDSDDLAITNQGEWNQKDSIITAYFADDTLIFQTDKEKHLTLLSWKEIEGTNNPAGNRYIFNAETPLNMDTFCGQHYSVIDSSITLQISLDTLSHPIVLINRVNNTPLQFKGKYINDCILLSLDEHFKNIKGEIVIRRNPSDLIDLNYFTPDSNFKLEEQGILLGEYN